jgi:hypothetical protein
VKKLLLIGMLTLSSTAALANDSAGPQPPWCKNRPARAQYDVSCMMTDPAGPQRDQCKQLATAKTDHDTPFEIDLFNNDLDGTAYLGYLVVCERRFNIKLPLSPPTRK